MKLRKFPVLNKSAITEQVALRTNMDKTLVNQILTAYLQIMTESLCAGVEFPLANLGRMTFVDVKPKLAGERWNGFEKKRMYMLGKKGFYRPVFKPSSKFKSKVKGATMYGDGPTFEELADWVRDTYGEDTEIKHTIEKYVKENGLSDGDSQ